MKRYVAALLSLCLALSIFGCDAQKQQETAVPPPEADVAANVQEQPHSAAEEWYYAVRLERTEKEFRADDGTIIATLLYEQPILYLRSQTRERFDGETPEFGVTQEQLDICRAFNDATAAKPDIWEGSDLEANAREQYAWRSSEGMEFIPLCEEMTVTETNLSGDFVSVLASNYIYLGGAHPDSAMYSWNYDLKTGTFFSWRDLTDHVQELHGELARNTIGKLSVDEERQMLFYDDYAETIEQTEDYSVWFGKDGMLLWFDEYEIAPYVAGILQVDIPYAEFSRYLNERGLRLLDLPEETRALGDYYEAEDFWCWFAMGAVPMDYEDERVEWVDFGDDNWEVHFYRVNFEGVSTLKSLRALLATRFSDEIVERLLSNEDIGASMFREFDGLLYCGNIAGRGDDLTIDHVDYQVDLGAESGKVIATIYRRDFDDETGDWCLTGETDRVEFPFERTENGARFTSFESVY